MKIDWNESLKMRENNIAELLEDTTKSINEKIETLKIWLKACKRGMANGTKLIDNDCVEEYRSNSKQYNLCEKALKELGYIVPKRKYRRFY
ncbi:MAG: hypothetical protein LIR50_19240 [Bacillota bacterium]|nr:hypothetical protein [Bacillota bacterium]